MVKKIPLTQGQHALVDDEDYEFLNQISWSTEHDKRFKSRDVFYARGGFEGKTVQMHRLIMGFPKKRHVDHINGNGLDNRRENLRIVSNRQNQQNRKRKTTSNYPGVYWHKGANKWVARIHMNGKREYLGSFVDEGKAAKAYENACHELAGEKLVCELESVKGEGK